MSVKRNGATYYSVTELAQMLNVHRATILNWIAAGELDAVRAGLRPKSPYLVPREEVERVLEELRLSDKGGS